MPLPRPLLPLPPLPRPLRLVPLLAASLAGAMTPAGGVAPMGQAPVHARPVARAAQDRDGLFRLTIAANGTPVRFVVDTGANVVVLTPRDAMRIGARSLAGTGQRLRTAVGDSAMVEARIEEMVIAGHRLGPVRAVIASGAPTSLLGQNVLGQIESVTLRGDRLELR